MRSKDLLRVFALAALVALGLPLQSDAQTAVACKASECLANAAVTQKVQPVGNFNDDDHGDMSFFSAQSRQLANVVFVLDNSTSMYELPYTKLASFPNTAWATDANPSGWATGSSPTTPPGSSSTDTTSCKSNAYFDGLRDANGLAYNKSTTYDPPDVAFSTDPKKYFDPAKAYRFMEWNSNSPGGSLNGTIPSPSAACTGSALSSAANSGGTSLTQQQRCQQCINEVGYYISPSSPATTFNFGAPVISVVGTNGAGSLSAGTYFYVVTAVLSNGETGIHSEGSATVSSNGKITIKFGGVFDRGIAPNGAFATSYRVYRGRTSGGENVFYDVNNVTGFPTLAQFVDTGASPTGAGAPPFANAFVGSVVFKGNWLNFNPPKFVLARKVLTDFISAQTTAAHPARVSVATYDPAATFPNEALCSGSSTGNTPGTAATSCFLNQPATSAGPSALQWRSGDGGHLLRTGMAPDCDQTSWLNSSGQPIAAQASLNTQIRAINFGTPPFNETTPLAETLFNVGQFLSGDNGAYTTKFGSGWIKPEFNAPTDASKPLCVGCQPSAVVLITDGSPQGDNNVPQELRTDSTATTGANAVCIPASNCGTDGSNASVNTLPAVANMLANTDLSTVWSGPQNVTTHVIVLGVSQGNLPPVLRTAAAKGQGQAFGATNSSQLQQRLADAVATVVKRGTAFSSASVSSLQIGNGSAVYVPRFTPAAQNVPIWKGQLLRFNIFNEFSANLDLDRDQKFDGVFLVDKPAPTAPPNSTGDIIVEDDQGNFVKQSDPTQRAVPFWDAGAVLQGTASPGDPAAVTFGPCAAGSSPPSCRNVFTAIADANGVWTTIPFVDTDTTRIGPLLGLTDAICAQIQATMTTPPSGTFTAANCQAAVINWARGKDIFGPNPTFNRTPMLGDIFHSSPIVVDPPVDEFLCQTGLHTQCLSTLFGYNAFAQQSSNVAQTPALKDASGTTLDAYDQYWQAHNTRPRIVMVGANDGMVHAFNSGKVVTPVLQTGDKGFRQIAYDDGDGSETWAFVSPDQLPRLAQMMIGGHLFSMDGDIMVRDVWVDGQGNDKAPSNFVNQPQVKQPEEFHTVAVISERQGGNHYVALDVTDTTNPKMLWMYPPPCSADEQVFGQSWSQFAPHAPPIGPVILKNDSAGPTRFNISHTEERWIAFLNGGHSPWNTRGRGLAMVDVYTGKAIFKATYDQVSSTPLSAMKFAFPAPVAMVDYNQGDLTATDGFFDTAVVGDEGGQVWAFHFFDPGNINSSTQLVDNWVFGRAFEASSGSTIDPRLHQPIYSMASTTVQPNNQTLRAFVGTGDRAHLRSTGGGDCRPDNPAACVAAGCTVSSSLSVDNGPNRYASTYASAGGNSSTNPAIAPPTQSATTVSANACTSATATETMTVSACTAAFPTTTPAFPNTEVVTASCSGSPLTCSDSGPIPTPNKNLGITSTSSQQNFFLGISILTSDLGAPTKARKLVDSSTYDSGRITFSDIATGELADVTATTATTAGVGGSPPAKRDGSGWIFKYGSVDEKTATGASLVNSCVVWSSLTPTGDGAGCNVASSSASLFQADAFTGAPNCVQSFLTNVTYVRSKARDVLSPPPEAAATVSVGPGNRSVKYSVLQIQPASGSGSEVNGVDFGTSKDLLKLISSVPLTADQHACRHGTDTTKCP